MYVGDSSQTVTNKRKSGQPSVALTSSSWYCCVPLLLFCLTFVPWHVCMFVLPCALHVQPNPYRVAVGNHGSPARGNILGLGSASASHTSINTSSGCKAAFTRADRRPCQHQYICATCTYITSTIHVNPSCTVAIAAIIEP